MNDDFYRIRRLPPYVFAEVNALKQAARASGDDVIDFGMGNPDQPPAPHILEKMQESLNYVKKTSSNWFYLKNKRFGV